MSWSYRTGEVTQRVIPAAEDCAPFHGTLDKEPDGESES